MEKSIFKMGKPIFKMEKSILKQIFHFKMENSILFCPP